MKTIDAGVLSVAYDEYGPADGWPCILGLGFPYDVHAYSDTAPILAEAGARVIVPFLRGFGPTRFLSAETPRSGERAALGADLLALITLASSRPRTSTASSRARATICRRSGRRTGRAH